MHQKNEPPWKVQKLLNPGLCQVHATSVEDLHWKTRSTSPQMKRANFQSQLVSLF